MDDLDFLQDDAGDSDAIRRTLERSRAAIAHWSAQALIRRHPGVDDAASARGKRMWQQELDRHLRKLQESWDDAPALILYADWVQRRRMAQGGNLESLVLAIDLLCEGLARHMEPELARPLVGALVEAFALPQPKRTAAYIGLAEEMGR